MEEELRNVSCMQLRQRPSTVPMHTPRLIELAQVPMLRDPRNQGQHKKFSHVIDILTNVPGPVNTDAISKCLCPNTHQEAFEQTWTQLPHPFGHDSEQQQGVQHGVRGSCVAQGVSGHSLLHLEVI